MSKISFFTLLPDDYHGAPRVDSISPPGPVPDPPDYDDVFAAWSEAGYNSYQMGSCADEDYDEDEDEDNEDDDDNDNPSEVECFEEYGYADFYCAVYMVISDEEDFLRRNESEIAEELGEKTGFYNSGPSGSPEDVCEILKNSFPQIKLIIPIKKGL
jgi:hypothetical protein